MVFVVIFVVIMEALILDFEVFPQLWIKWRSTRWFLEIYTLCRYSCYIYIIKWSLIIITACILCCYLIIWSWFDRGIFGGKYKIPLWIIYCSTWASTCCWLVWLYTIYNNRYFTLRCCISYRSTLDCQVFANCYLLSLSGWCDCYCMWFFSWVEYIWCKTF